FGLLVGLAHRLGLASDLKTAVSEAVDLLRRENARFGADSPVTGNPAKRGAGQLMGRIPVIYGGGIFEPVARRWKCQFNENSKVWAQFEALPEANHNAVVGWEYPDDLISHMAALFITSRQHDHPRVGLRHELTFKMCLQNAIMADIFQPEGTSKLAQMMHAIQYGDYVSYYMAIGYGVDPTAIEPLVELKHQLAQRT
ncbi:MAG: hypothetical protein JW966_11030, partial [Anaerolineae bacterium]|nr:hypothetical protein [Anaerolineae bacterium]